MQMHSSLYFQGQDSSLVIIGWPFCLKAHHLLIGMAAVSETCFINIQQKKGQSAVCKVKTSEKSPE